MVRAVLFDLDDTLFDHRGCSRDALGAVRRCHERLDAMPLEELEQIHSRLLEQLHGDVMLGMVPLEDARRERFRRLLEAAGATPSDDLVEAARPIALPRSLPRSPPGRPWRRAAARGRRHAGPRRHRLEQSLRRAAG